MQHSIALMPPPRNFEAPSSFETRIHGRLLLIVRVAWLVVAISCAGLAMVSLPFTFIQIQTVCTGSACSWVQLTPSQVQTLHHLGFSETWYAAVIIAVNVLCIIVTYGFASIVMWSRSGEFMALFFAFLLITCETTPHGASEALVVKVFPVLLIPSQV